MIHCRAIGIAVVCALAVVGCGQGGSTAPRTDTRSTEGQYAITYNVTVSRQEGGTVRSLGSNGAPDGKIDCGPRTSACGPTSYAWTEVPSFAALPESGFRFVAWAADCSGTGACSVTTANAGADKWVSGVFSQAAQTPGKYFWVTVSRPTLGTITSSGGEIRCGPAPADTLCGPAHFDWNSQQTLTATPVAGYALGEWSGDCTGSGPCSLGTSPSATDKFVGASFNQAFYAPVGPQTNVPVSALVGWTPCYTDTYANPSTPLSTITSQCNKAKLMLACRPVATPDTLTLLAWAPRADVLFDTGTGNVPHLANGSSWYFNGSSSWGFAPAGAVIDRYTCDVAGGNPGWGPPYDAPPYTLDSTSPGRLCWHTGGQFINTGWRCGAAVWLNSDPNWVRVVYQAD